MRSVRVNVSVEWIKPCEGVRSERQISKKIEEFTQFLVHIAHSLQQGSLTLVASCPYPERQRWQDNKGIEAEEPIPSESVTYLGILIRHWSIITMSQTHKTAFRD